MGATILPYRLSYLFPICMMVIVVIVVKVVIVA